MSEVQGVIQGDCLEVMRSWPEKCVDLVFDSPPYEDARTYGIGFKLKGQAWVDWMVERTIQSLRVCRGLVATVVEGKTKQFRWSATPALLMAALHQRGVCLRKPPVFHRVGIAGSGGPDWLRNDYEFIVCCTNGGKLPWSDNTAMGHPPKWAPGGAMSHRVSSGSKVNQWGHPVESGATVTKPDGSVRSMGRPPSHRLAPKVAAVLCGDLPGKVHTKNNGTEMVRQAYTPPVLANPGNVLHYKVGGGIMGSRLCHENEAPFPEKLAEFFIRSFCPPGGIVLDRFCGSGTTLAVAKRHGRNFVGIDVRKSQVELALRRLEEVTLTKEATHVRDEKPVHH
jgi:hypothetical protein